MFESLFDPTLSDFSFFDKSRLLTCQNAKTGSPVTKREDRSQKGSLSGLSSGNRSQNWWQVTSLTLCDRKPWARPVPIVSVGVKRRLGAIVARVQLK
jgi:hypothetical protein